MSRLEVSIDSFCETGSGSTPSRSVDRYFGGGIPWVKSGELRDDVLLQTEESVSSDGVAVARLKVVPADTVLVAMYGATAGRTALLGVSATTNQAICHVRPDPARADTRFLWFALQAKLPELLLRRVGGAQPNISQETIRSTKVYLPTLVEQRRIAHILGKADIVRRKRAAATALSEELIRSAFLERFGDPMANSRGWPVHSLADLCESKQYGTAEKANSEHRGVPVLRMNNLSYAGDVDLTELKWVELKTKDLSRLDLRDGDVLFNRVNSHALVGKTAVWHHGEGYTFAGYLIRLRPRDNVATGDYIATAMNLPSTKRRLMGMAKPSINMANISASDLARLFLPVPPLALQREFSAFRRSAETLRRSYREGAEILECLFASLMSRAFRGELAEKDATRQLSIFDEALRDARA